MKEGDKQLIIIHGMSGSGKTLLAQGLKAAMGMRFFNEPVTVFDNLEKRDLPEKWPRILNESGHVIVTMLDEPTKTMLRKATRIIAIRKG